MGRELQICRIPNGHHWVRVAHIRCFIWTTASISSDHFRTLFAFRADGFLTSILGADSNAAPRLADPSGTKAGFKLWSNNRRGKAYLRNRDTIPLSSIAASLIISRIDCHNAQDNILIAVTGVRPHNHHTVCSHSETYAISQVGSVITR